MFTIDLQVQIHVPDTRAPKVISMVGTMLNLVNEVLQSAVGNHFRNTLQDLAAVTFIETRMQVQQAALRRTSPSTCPALRGGDARASTSRTSFPGGAGRGADPAARSPTRRQATFEEQQRAQTARIEMEKAKGTADMQAELAAAQVSVDINSNQAEARQAEAEGEAAYVELTGRAEADQVEAIGLAEAKATEALGVARADGLRGAARRSARPRPRWWPWRTPSPRGTSTSCPRCSSPAGPSLDGLASALTRALNNGKLALPRRFELLRTETVRPPRPAPSRPDEGGQAESCPSNESRKPSKDNGARLTSSGGRRRAVGQAQRDGDDRTIAVVERFGREQLPEPPHRTQHGGILARACTQHRREPGRPGHPEQPPQQRRTDPPAAASRPAPAPPPQRDRPRRPGSPPR